MKGDILKSRFVNIIVLGLNYSLVFLFIGGKNSLLKLLLFFEYRSSTPVVLGSLTMYPPAVDNYGIDCCSIMCIQTTPPIVVIADCSGKIYHAILLADDFEDEEKKVSFDKNHF